MFAECKLAGRVARRARLGAALAALLVGCGGKAVIDAAGGSGGETTTTTTTTTTTAQFCTSHADCPGAVCVFSTGTCAPSCVAQSCDSCGAGLFCEPCITASCPSCADCVAACVPTGAGRCDEDDPCPPGQLCQWSWGSCLDGCGPGGDCGPWSYCDACATSSGCGDADCVAACMGGE